MSQDATIEPIFGAEFKRPSSHLVADLSVLTSPAPMAMYLKAVSPHQATTVLIPDHACTQNLPTHFFFLGLFLFVTWKRQVFQILENRCEDNNFVFTVVNFPVLLT